MCVLCCLLPAALAKPTHTARDGRAPHTLLTAIAAGFSSVTLMAASCTGTRMSHRCVRAPRASACANARPPPRRARHERSPCACALAPRRARTCSSRRPPRAAGRCARAGQAAVHARTLHAPPLPPARPAPRARLCTQGAVSVRSLHQIANLRQQGIKHVVISGARVSTLLMRLPFLPASDALVCENGGSFEGSATPPPSPCRRHFARSKPLQSAKVTRKHEHTRTHARAQAAASSTRAAISPSVSRAPVRCVSLRWLCSLQLKPSVRIGMH